jgi:hypothetical protein
MQPPIIQSYSKSLTFRVVSTVCRQIKKHAEIIGPTYLQSADCDVWQVDSEGRTAMIAACYMGHMDCVRQGARIPNQAGTGSTSDPTFKSCEE